MAKHQIIYTSCMRGIDGVNDGQQIFSYDKDFTDSKSDAVKSLFTFQIPALEPGQIMTEEIAKEMPSAFLYRYLDNGKCAVTLNTYLGRDYMGSAGRFGNHLSHSIVCDFPDFNMYPCEIYGSSCLRDHMEFEEVNNPNPPDYLPTPELEKGYYADIDSIIDFLGEEENLEYLKKMVVAMISFKSERKRVVICDEPQRIIKWIAALQYVLPIDIAKRINFTTYEFDPELSPAQICGVVKSGTRYNSQTYVQSGRHFVFDFINNQFSNIEINEEPFIDFVDTSMSFSYDSLTEFFQFVINNTNYRELDEQYYNCYLLYSLFSDGFSEITEDQFCRLTDFADEHLIEDDKKRILSILTESSDIINSLENEYALKVLRYLLKHSAMLSADQMKNVKQLAVNRITYSLSDSSITEEEFSRLYDSVDEIARSQNVSIPAELMNDDNRDSVLGVISGNTVAEWKVYSIIRIISDYVKDMKMPCEELYPDRITGKLYQGIFTAIYSSDSSKGQKLIVKILDNFKDKESYLANMALNIEGYLKDISGGDKSIEYLWNKYGEHVAGYDNSRAEEASAVFAECERYDLIYTLYNSRLSIVSQFEEARTIIRDAVDNKFKKYPVFAQKHASDILYIYYNKYEDSLKTMSDDDAVKYAKELVRDSINNKVEGTYLEPLIEALSCYMPIGKLEKSDIDLINDIVNYQSNTRQKNIEGRLLLLVIGVYFDKMINKRDIEKYATEIMKLSGNTPARLKEDEKTTEKYFDWILPNVLKYPLEAADYKAVYDLFNMSVEAKNEFMLYCCKESYKKSKSGSKDVIDFSEFLLFMFESGDRNDLDLVGKYLCKLSKQKLAELDDSMRSIFKKDRKAAHNWDAIREVAESTNPLLNNLSGLFKKIKN